MQVTSCQLCGSTMLRLLLDLGKQPLAEAHRSDAPKYPLRLVGCQVCGLTQLDYIAPQGEVFPRNHPYASGNAKALHEHFQALADHFDYLPDDSLIVDIGCNDGTLLSKFPERFRRIGVDPTDQMRKAPKGSVQGFFTAKLAKQLVHQHGKAKLITATNVLAHCPDPHDFLEGVNTLLAADGTFVTENHDVAEVLGGQWDTVYHEHLRYYSSETITQLLNRHGLGVIKHERIPTHGGSIRTYAHAAGLQGSADRAVLALRDILQGLPEKVVGIGATTRASGLLHFAGIASHIAAVCEVSTSDKIGLVMPGTHIPIIDEAVLFGDDQPRHALLFSWHLQEHIVPKLREKGYRGDIIVPLPTPKVMTHDLQHV